jgi:hypothetical protein
MHEPKEKEIEVEELGGEPVEGTGFEGEQAEVETTESLGKGVQQ